MIELSMSASLSYLTYDSITPIPDLLQNTKTTEQWDLQMVSIENKANLRD